MAKPKRDHYATLGVEPTAPPEKVKRAYRRKARETHPDTNGDDATARMAEINEAWRVLGDPVRRQLYDATGEDKPHDTDAEIRNLVLQVFNEALQQDASDILRFAKNALSGKLNDLKGQRSQAETKQKSLRKRRDKITVKGKENLFHLIIDQQIHAIDGALLRLQHAMDVFASALKALDAYKSSEEVTAVTSMIWSIQMGSATTGTR